MKSRRPPVKAYANRKPIFDIYEIARKAKASPLRSPPPPIRYQPPQPKPKQRLNKDGFYHVEATEPQPSGPLPSFESEFETTNKIIDKLRHLRKVTPKIKKPDISRDAGFNAPSKQIKFGNAKKNYIRRLPYLKTPTSQFF